MGQKQTRAPQLAMSAMGQKRASANKLQSCPTCFSWAVLQALQRFGNAATTGHYLRPILSRSLGGSYMGTRSAQGTFVANLPL